MNDRFKPSICGDGKCGAYDCARCYPQFIHKPTDEVVFPCPKCDEELMLTKQEIADLADKVTCLSCGVKFILPDVLWE